METDASRLLLVAENDDFLDGLASWLVRSPDLVIVGRAHSGGETMDRMSRVNADLVLMDISLPDMSGLTVARRLKQLPRSPLVLLMTFHDSRAAAVVARDAGVDGCLTKAQIPEELLPAIRAALQTRAAGGAAGTAPGRKTALEDSSTE